VTAASSTAAPADRTLLTSRVFDAPRDLVFKAWTDPTQLAKWFPPDHFTSTCETDVRPGGRIRIDMRAPDGTIFPAQGTYREVVPNERIAFTLAGVDGGIPPEVLMTVVFDDLAGKTKVSISQTMATVELFSGMKGPMSQGLAQSMDKLAVLLGHPAGTTAMVAERTLILTRTFGAPRELVFTALTDPKHLVKWMFANDWESPFAETDLKTGGKWRFGMRPADHSHEGFVFEGTYSEITPPERIVHAIVDGRIMKMILEDLGGKTRLTLSVDMVMSAEQEQKGYSEILEHFAQHLAALSR